MVTITITSLLKTMADKIEHGQYTPEQRTEAIRGLVDCLTELGVVVFYYDDLEKRREDKSLNPDTPVPAGIPTVD